MKEVFLADDVCCTKPLQMSMYFYVLFIYPYEPLSSVTKKQRLLKQYSNSVFPFSCLQCCKNINVIQCTFKILMIFVPVSSLAYQIT